MQMHKAQQVGGRRLRDKENVVLKFFLFCLNMRVFISSSVSMEMQIKATVLQGCITKRMAKINRCKYQCWQRLGVTGTLVYIYTAYTRVKRHNHVEKNLAVFYKLNMQLPYNPSIVLQDFICNRNACIHSLKVLKQNFHNNASHHSPKLASIQKVINHRVGKEIVVHTYTYWNIMQDWK